MTPSPSISVLIVCSHFWPSLGGIETSLGQLGTALSAEGYHVTVLTLAFPGRSSDHHAGVRIWSCGQPEFAATIRQAVASGDFDACVLIQDPLGAIVWSVEGLTPPPGTRLLIQPVINEDGFARWGGNADFSQRLAAILRSADVPLVMTQSGPDTRYMRSVGLEPVYLPNACEPVPPAGDFRAEFAIAPDRFLVLHVANLYAVKNHLGLIDALSDMPPDWQLVMIGNVNPGSDYAAQVKARLRERPEILFIPGLPPEWVSAAMHAADVVVLASHGEGSPITILEAMAHQKPWLATPQCGAANDHLGGIVTPLQGFKAHLSLLARDAALRADLGQLAHDHWQDCYAWPVVIQGWKDLITSGHLHRQFVPQPERVQRMQALRQRIQASLPPADLQNRLHEALAVCAQGQFDVNALLGLAEQLGRAGQPEAAITLYRAWLRGVDSPGVAYAAWFNLGVLQEQTGAIDQALQAYRRAVALKPDMAVARYRLALGLDHTGAAEAQGQWAWLVDPAHGVQQTLPEVFARAQQRLAAKSAN